MKNYKSIVVLVFFTAIFAVVSAQEEVECRGEPVVLTDKEREQVQKCMNESGITNILKIPVEKLPCFGVCILKEKDMLTEDGKINHSKALKYIEKHIMKKETQKLLIDAADKCIKDHGEQVKKDDDKCLTFLEVGQCVHDQFLEICYPG